MHQSPMLWYGFGEILTISPDPNIDFESILPLACEWARDQEKMILEKGRLLLPELINDAKRVDVELYQVSHGQVILRKWPSFLRIAVFNS